LELVAAIREAPCALVFLSVPWSGPERQGRQVFRAAAGILGEKHKDLGISFYRLEVDEDETSQRWVASIGYPQFAATGAGSLLWLQEGQVLDTEINASYLGVSGIVARSTSLWGNQAQRVASADRPRNTD
jgi:hypothetical protein